ncbi:hypothetical protein COLO4_13591 [Corchorus olitorius]|uniref:Uncharacterized protein n=1 Tax=Corchorus olitorius TaxID=93759 RepID=A0A1R3JVQ5_9ROSI|nr:hypothetical protein COLO4_13591 [Corchorus olitorius]
MSAHANPAVCPNSSSNTPVPSHPYGTRTKTKALAQNLKMLNHNSLFDASSTIFKEVSEEQFSKLQPVKQEDDCSSNGSIPSSPRQNWCAKNVVEQDPVHGEGGENSLKKIIKAADQQKVSELINPSQQKVSEMINPSQLKELIKEAIKDQVEMDAKPLKISKKKAQDAKSFTNQDKAKGKFTLKERREKKYPFPDSDVASMLDELLKSKVIELPEMKRLEESGKVDDPNYCKYHRLVSHPVEKCFVLKDKIMELHSEGIIEFEEEVASSNVASITRVIPEYEVLTMAIKFGSFDPIILPVASTKLATSQQTGGSHFSETNEDEDNEGWTLVTRHRAKKNHPKCVKVLETQKKAHQLISKPKHQLVQRKKTPSEFHKASQKHVKRPITLNEFMPSQLREVKFHSPRKPEDGEAKPHILEKSDQKKKELSQPVKRVDEITKNLGNLTLPLTSLQKDEVTKPSLKGFVRPSKEPLVEHDELPSQRANCFDPNAYRLLVKAGYDYEDVTKMANETRTIWQKKVKPTKQGLGFSPVKLKIHKKTAAYITADEVDENDEIMVESPRISVFDRLENQVLRGLHGGRKEEAPRQVNQTSSIANFLLEWKDEMS